MSALRIQVQTAEHRLEEYSSKLSKLESDLEHVTAPNARAAPLRLLQRCRTDLDALGAELSDALQLPTTTSPVEADLQALEQSFADARSALDGVPEYARTRLQSSVYTPPPEFNTVMQLLTARGDATQNAVLVNGSPGVGKSAMMHALVDYYHQVCLY